MIDTVAIKTKIIDLAVTGQISSQFHASDSVIDIITALPPLSKKRKKHLEQNYDYGKQAILPNHWKWVRLGELSSYGDTPQKSKLEDVRNDMWILDLEDIKSGGEVISKKRVNEKKFKGEKTHFFNGQVLYSKLRPYLKKVLVADEDGISTPELISFDVFGGMIPQYVVYCLLSSFTDKAIEKRSYGIKMPRIDAGFMVNLPIPVPPISEQQYIVEHIQAAFSQMDLIDKLQTQYADNLTALKSKLIDAAIQGKMTEQLPEDGTAEELYQQIQEEKQKLIKEGKIKKQKPYSKSPVLESHPFDIPDNWKFVRFGELMINRDSERIPVSVADRRKRKKIFDYYGASGVIDGIDEYLFDEQLLLIGEDGANLLARTRPVAFIAKGKYWVNNHAHVLDICCDVNLEYICYYINAISLQPYVTGMAQPKMNQENMNAIWVPLPPLAEQKRIVQKLNEILPLCEKIK